VRVIYDISILGHGYRVELARTGIFRVVDRTAHGLESREDLSLELSSSESWENYYWAERFLQQDERPRGDLLIPKGAVARGLFHAQDVFYGDHAGARRTWGAKTTTRIVRRLTGAVTSRLSSLPASSVAGRDIFHSGYHALPSTTKGVKGLRRFLTVYDLIPVLKPHLFADGVSVVIRQIFQSMLQSIGPEDFVLTISESTKADLCSYLPIDPSHVFVSPLAAAPELFYPVQAGAAIDAVRARHGIPGGCQYLLSVNTLEPRKNMEHAIRCFSALLQAEQIRDLYFVLVGTNGWRHEQILEAATNGNLAGDRIIVTGYLPDQELAPLYSGALAFVYPSLYEGFGLPPLEAMQCGTPVIASNTSSLPEVVGDAGIMVSPTDADALSQAMRDLYQQPELRTASGTRAIERAKLFSWNAYTDKVVAAYRTAAST
jgi:glycosyltransferase involved in cell wall biosynthesis